MTNDEKQLNLFDNLGKSANFQPDLIPTDVKVPIPPGTYQTIDLLAKHCNECYRCELGETRTHAVVERGDREADIMIIGEAPGQNEDETGLPFVGKSGQLLDKILASVKLDPEEDVYVANIVKCLTGDTLIFTTEGYLRLDWIVKNRWLGKVLSVNNGGELVWQKITNWYQSPLAGRKLYQVTFPGQEIGYTATADHPILTHRGWISVAELQANDLVATGMPKSGLEALMATAFADFCVISKRKPNNFKYHEESFVTEWQPAIKREISNDLESPFVYCLDVEETANFVTPAGVVHNCRPPGNRTPTAKEISACKPYLLEQIRLVNPKIILFTGATSLKGLTGEKKGISKVRGEWIEWEGRLCMAIFHPAYLLRNPSKEKGKPKWLMWQDIQKVRAKLDELNSEL
ncbi:hypothetical protein G3T18_08595 [Oscillatoria salina IIICB1]|nr:hypothetical protein [Oscillatoria salina IIICB1]